VQHRSALGRLPILQQVHLVVPDDVWSNILKRLADLLPEASTARK